MSTTRQSFAADYDAARGLRGLSRGSDAFVNQILTFKDLTGKGFGKAVENAIETYAFLRLEVTHEARSTLLSLTDERDAIKKERHRRDAEKVLAQIRKGETADLGDDGLEDLEKAVEAQERLNQALNVATSAQRRYVVALMQEGDKALGIVSKVYAETVGWEPKPSTTYGEVVAHDSTSAKVLAICRGFAVALQGQGDWTKQQRQEYVKQFDALPPAMPTLETVNKALSSARDATPMAKQAKAAEATKKAQQVEARLSAQAAAKARNRTPSE